MNLRRSFYKQLFFSNGFLALFLAYFTLNVLVVLSNPAKDNLRATVKKEYKQGSDLSSAAEEFFSEEKEGDGKDNLEPFQTMLPSFFVFDVLYRPYISIASCFFNSVNNSPPIFLVTGDLRI